MNISTKRYKNVGILGGMGPRASVYAHEKLLDYYINEQGSHQDEDFPTIIHYSLPLNGFSEKGFNDSVAIGIEKQLSKAVKCLESAGSELIIIVCNTVHLFFSKLQKKTDIKIINLIEEVTKETIRKDMDFVGILSSDTTRRTGLYQEYLDKYNVKHLGSTLNEQKKIDSVILRAMNNTNSVDDLKDLVKIINRMQNMGVKGVVLGCTELPLVFDKFKESNLFTSINIPIIDSVEVIVKRIGKYSIEEKY